MSNPTKPHIVQKLKTQVKREKNDSVKRVEKIETANRVQDDLGAVGPHEAALLLARTNVEEAVAACKQLRLHITGKERLADEKALAILDTLQARTTAVYLDAKRISDSFNHSIAEVWVDLGKRKQPSDEPVLLK